MIRVAQVACLVGEVLRPVRVVLGVVEREGVRIGRVGDEDGELGRHPQPEIVELLGVALDDIEARAAVADGGDHLVLTVRVVRVDEPVETGQELAHRQRLVARPVALDYVLERRAHASWLNGRGQCRSIAR